MKSVIDRYNKSKEENCQLGSSASEIKENNNERSLTITNSDYLTTNALVFITHGFDELYGFFKRSWANSWRKVARGDHLGYSSLGPKLSPSNPKSMIFHLRSHWPKMRPSNLSNDGRTCGHSENTIFSISRVRCGHY
ncbi:hypothetical protein V8G54_037557 [Vigna mungo]|uniref:Uncharacterized protein n=1 Tax=Vigna mungo TaxID=3915 RepID=A0AAQ3RE80_VIGMU